eukprot:scaffold11802_cov202-Skeletonema_dohrnii-CCMP3373.AAC.5
MAADEWYIYYGRDGEVIPPGVTRVRIHESLTVIPARAFQGKRNIVEVECHYRVKTVGRAAFYQCPSLRIVIMPGVEVVKVCAFNSCEALAHIECDKLERIGNYAFSGCNSLGIINLPSAKIVGRFAFSACFGLTNIKFGKELESIEDGAFFNCTSLERITIPLKDGMIAADDTFQGCENLKHVDLVEGALHDTIAALLLEEWRNDMNEEINSINQILSNAPAGDANDDDDDVGGKAQAVRMWIRTVLRNIIRYKTQQQNLLNEAATALQSFLPSDIVFKNVLPFLELPSFTFEGENI